jgi:hypothetical protein
MTTRREIELKFIESVVKLDVSLDDFTDYRWVSEIHNTNREKFTNFNKSLGDISRYFCSNCRNQACNDTDVLSLDIIEVYVKMFMLLDNLQRKSDIEFAELTSCTRFQVEMWMGNFLGTFSKIGECKEITSFSNKKQLRKYLGLEIDDKKEKPELNRIDVEKLFMQSVLDLGVALIRFTTYKWVPDIKNPDGEKFRNFIHACDGLYHYFCVYCRENNCENANEINFNVIYLYTAMRTSLYNLQVKQDSKILKLTQCTRADIEKWIALLDGTFSKISETTKKRASHDWRDH